MKKRSKVWKPFLKFYTRFPIPWWLFLLSLGMGILSAEIALRVAEYTIRINKGELYNSVILGYVLLTVLNSLVSALQNVLSGYGTEKIVLRSRRTLWHKILRMPQKEIDRKNPSSLISAVTNDVTQASTAVTMLFLFGSSIYGFVKACVVMYQYNASLTAYLLLIIPLMVFLFYLVGKTQFILMRRRYESLGVMTEFFSEHLSCAKHVKAQGMEEEEIRAGFEAIDSRYRADVLYAFLGALQKMLYSIYSNLCTVVMAVGGSSLIRAGKLEDTGINSFSTYMSRVNQYLSEILTQYQSIKGTQGALLTTNELLDAEEEDTGSGKELTPGRDKDIVFEHVSFGYGDNGEVLHDVSFRIPWGKTVAVIGNNGSGKSTLFKLMQGFYTPDTGRIYIGEGNELPGVKLGDVRQQFSYILQDNPMFAGTVRDNIAYGMELAATLEEQPLFSGTVRENIAYGMDEKPTDEEIARAAQLADADGFIRELPEGYETWVGEGGCLLSGGQRQRIAIARALLLDRDYLLMDEAGASLDYQSYSRVYEGVKERMRGRTILYIAHNMDEINGADEILVMNQGRLEASGTPEELMKASPTYRGYVERLRKREA